MKLDLIKYAVGNIMHRKLRSFLSVLSILIGVTAIFALISFGQGINHYVNNFAQEMGTDKIIMMPGGFSAPGTSNIVFTDDDLDFIEKINGVDVVTGLRSESGKIEFKDYKPVYTYMFGFSTEPKDKELVKELFGGIGIEKGRDIKSGDKLKVVLGHNYLVPDKLFKKAIDVGDKVEVNDVEVEVVGFFEEVGSPQDDSQMYFTFDGIDSIFGKGDYEFIYIRSAPGVDPGELADRINEKFRKYKDQKKGEEDFEVQTFQDMIATFTSVIMILNGVLVLIALISVVVAAVNIMNTTYTAILERTQEIGVMKAVGAKNNHILLIFIIESGLLGLVGGIFGIILGYIFAKIGEYIAVGYGLAMLKPYFPLWLVIGCLLFAFLVGSGSGYLPSRQASKLQASDALRYE